jgi:hypothetical protein
MTASVVGEKPRYFKSDVPRGKSGPWVVEKFIVEDRPAPSVDERPRCFQHRPGQYTRLKMGHEVFMTDLFDEWWTQKKAADEATDRGGHVLITGLGLGLIVESMLRIPGGPVQSVTVVERSSDVVHLVGPHLLTRYGDRLKIVNGDAFTWQPPSTPQYSIVWHDIWPNPHDPSVKSEMDRLENRYRNCCDWQGFWPAEYYAAESA